MKLTLQAEDVRKFRRLVSTLIVRPTNTMVQFVDYHGKFAMMISGYNWTFVMPVRGRKPTKPFKIPFLPLWNTCERTDDKLTVLIDTKKGRGAVEWIESQNWRGSHPFTFGLYNYTVSPIPQEPTETKTCATPLLSPLAKCSKICAKCQYPSLAVVRITPGGEFGCTDGKQMLLEQTSARLPWSENILVHATDLYRVRMREFRDYSEFKLGVNDGEVCFDFGDCRFFTKPDADHYPKDLHRILPNEEGIQTRLELDPADARFLKDALPSGKSKPTVILCCDYDKTVSVYEEEANRLTRLVRSKFSGDALVMRLKPDYLLDAISHNCFEFHFSKPYPLAFNPGTTRFCWIPEEMSFLPLESERPPRSATIVLSDQEPSTKRKRK